VRIINGAQQTEGSGVLLHQSGSLLYVLTAAHVVALSERVEVQTFSAESYPRPSHVYRDAKVLAQAKDEDLAVLQLRESERAPGTLALCPRRLLPQTASFPGLTSGCSNRQAPTCQVDRVLGERQIRRPGEDVTRAWEVAHPVTPGRSGGPLVERHGYLL